MASKIETKKSRCCSIASYPGAAGIYQKVTWLMFANRLLMNRQPDCEGRTVIGALCPINSVVRELAFLSLVKPRRAAGLFRLEESPIRQLSVRICRFSLRRPERCAHVSPPEPRR